MLVFATVIDCGSFTAAGRHLDLSKSVISKHITKLEKQLGVTLLHRTTRRLHMTEAGEQLYFYCQRIMRDLKEAQQAIGPLQNEPRGLLRIGAPKSIGMSMLPDVMTKFHSKFPKVTIEVQVSGRHMDLVDEGYDLSLRFFHNSELQDSSLKARKLMQGQFVVCASPDYLNKHPLIHSPSDLVGHNCLIYTQRAHPHQWLFMGKAGQTQAIKVDGNLKSNDPNLLLRSTLAGHGLIFGPDFIFKKHFKSKALVPILTDYNLPPSTLYVIYPGGQFVPLKLRAFIDFLVQEWSDPPIDR